MAQLPKKRKQQVPNVGSKSHPFMTAAAMFIILMTGSVFSTYNQDEHFSVSKQPNLVVEGETVLIVPEGRDNQGKCGSSKW